MVKCFIINCLVEIIIVSHACSKESSRPSFPVLVISSRISFFKSYITHKIITAMTQTSSIPYTNYSKINDDIILISLVQSSIKLPVMLFSFAHMLTASSSGMMMATAHDLRLSPYMHRSREGVCQHYTIIVISILKVSSILLARLFVLSFIPTINVKTKLHLQKWDKQKKNQCMIMWYGIDYKCLNSSHMYSYLA